MRLKTVASFIGLVSLGVIALGLVALRPFVVASVVDRVATVPPTVVRPASIDSPLVVEEERVPRPVRPEDLIGLTLRERLEKIAPRATGIAEVDVTSIEQFDKRPACGPLYLQVKFRVLRSTGKISDYVNVTLAADHPLSSRRPFKPYGPVKRDTFAAGERYWVAFSSKYDYQCCPQGVVEAWPEASRPDDFEEAIRIDVYHDCPEYHPESGLTQSHRAETDKSWLAFVERDGKRLWERTMPGVIDEGWHNSFYVYDRERSTELRQTAGPKWLLSAMTTCHLEADNPYSYPVGDARLMYAMDVETGKAEVIWVTYPNGYPPANPGVIQFFDLTTGNVRREERYGPLATGNAEETRRLQLVRTFDPNAGKLQREEMLQWALGSNGGQYVPMDRPSTE
jgi:hypothetical protein